MVEFNTTEHIYYTCWFICFQVKVAYLGFQGSGKSTLFKGVGVSSGEAATKTIVVETYGDLELYDTPGQRVDIDRLNDVPAEMGRLCDSIFMKGFNRRTINHYTVDDKLGITTRDFQQVG